jgi:hypothetical protein
MYLRKVAGLFRSQKAFGSKSETRQTRSTQDERLVIPVGKPDDLMMGDEKRKKLVDRLETVEKHLHLLTEDMDRNFPLSASHMVAKELVQVVDVLKTIIIESL